MSGRISAMRRLMKEISALQANPPTFFQLQLVDGDMTDLICILAGPEDTPYQGGSFQISMVFGDTFPSSPPLCRFLTKIYHPNVSPAKGEICLNILKKDWRSDLGLADIINTIRCLLINPNAESALNEEAGKLLLEHFDDFSARARLMTSIHAMAQSTTVESKPLAKTSNVLGPITSANLTRSSQDAASTDTKSSLDVSATKSAAPAARKKNLRRL